MQPSSIGAWMSPQQLQKSSETGAQGTDQPISRRGFWPGVAGKAQVRLRGSSLSVAPADVDRGHSGIGAASHITCILLFQLIGAEPTHVSYRGFGQTINDILSGAIDGSCDLVASVSGQVQAGSVKAFAVAAPERSPIVPTATEAGMPDLAAETWTGLYAPKGVPPEILAKLRDAVAKSLDEPQVQARFLKIGATVPKPERRGGEAMLALVEQEVVRSVEFLRKAGLPEQ